MGRAEREFDYCQNCSVPTETNYLSNIKLTVLRLEVEDEDDSWLSNTLHLCDRCLDSVISEMDAVFRKFGGVG